VQMRILVWDEEKQARMWMEKAWEIAQHASCERSKCWSVVVKDWVCIWAWYNSPAKELESQRRCSADKMSYHRKVTDKTCCIHAEQRALFDALRNHPEQIEWSILYFIRLDKDWNLSRAGKPYCTICSKMALELWVAEFVLWHDEGITAYNTEEYNLLSYQYEE
jgi:deoxycytidylate deaminase